MKILKEIEGHPFVAELFRDAENYFGNRKHSAYDIELKGNEFDELEYYIHNVGFYTINFIALCKQLVYGTEFISNYSYSKKTCYNRIDHLRYNIENYIIRFCSVSDRLLQVINAVFHLTIDEGSVNYNSIMTNMKVKRTNIPAKFDTLNKRLKKYSKERNITVHRHSYLEKELRRLELFYHKNNSDIEKELKFFRSRELKLYIQSKKSELEKYNEEVFSLIPKLFDSLMLEYKKQRRRLELYTSR